MKDEELAAIIVAAGQSRRMGFDKLFALLDGQPVVAHSISIFEKTDCVSDIILVGRKGHLRELKEVVRKNRFRKVSRIIAGGARRQDSVRLGLEQLSVKVKYVAVHDAARPLVRPFDALAESIAYQQLSGKVAIVIFSGFLAIAVVLTVIGTFKAFNHIYVMTRGGPAFATETSSLYIFRQMYEFNRYGYSAALSFILFAVILVLTIAQNRLAGSRVVYD